MLLLLPLLLAAAVVSSGVISLLQPLFMLRAVNGVSSSFVDSSLVVDVHIAAAVA